MKYIKRENGEGWAIRNREPFRISCCDCGLVHNMVVSVSGKRRGASIGIAAERNERATRAKRRKSPPAKQEAARENGKLGGRPITKKKTSPA